MAEQGNITSALTVADLNTKVNQEPRVSDLRLGFSLGMKNPASAMRQLIERHRAPLERFGIVLTTAVKTSSQGGRPGKTYWLNKKQALYLCTKSEAPMATETTIQMVEVFDAYLVGTLRPVKVKEHRRSMPQRGAEPGREPRKFDTGSDTLRDMIAAVGSANERVRCGQAENFGDAFQQVLEDILTLSLDPLHKRRGFLWDHNATRACQAGYDKLRAQGREDVKFPTRPTSH